MFVAAITIAICLERGLLFIHLIVGHVTSLPSDAWDRTEQLYSRVGQVSRNTNSQLHLFLAQWWRYEADPAFVPVSVQIPSGIIFITIMSCVVSKTKTTKDCQPPLSTTTTIVYLWILITNPCPKKSLSLKNKTTTTD